MSAFSPSAAMPLQGLTLPPAKRSAVQAPVRPPSRSRTNARTRQAARARPAVATSLGFAWFGLVLVLVLETALLFFPDALRVSPVQAAVWFKQVSGYTMCALLAFALASGWLRRLPALAGCLRALGVLHQVGGLAILLLLACHMGQAPSGFLLCVFHGMACSVASGALRTVLASRTGRRVSTGLLGLHIGMSCMVAAGAVLHLYFVYVYAA